MDWMKFRKLYFTFSSFFVAIGIFSLIRWGFQEGVDFKGGTITLYEFEEPISEDKVSEEIEKSGVSVNSIQKTGEKEYIFRFSHLSVEEHEKVKKSLSEVLKGKNFEELSFETVGPTIGPELVKKTIFAISIAASSILLWVAFQFKSIKFGTSAIFAMFHDSFILVGIFSILGHFLSVEIDFLFVTALLTTLSFSVHDTIVVYDRIRELQKKFGGSLYELANKAITETMVRSINNSFTIIFMLISLVLLGGETVRWFAVALLIGTFFGTYSSPFVAVPLLVTLDEVFERIRRRK